MVLYVWFCKLQVILYWVLFNSAQVKVKEGITNYNFPQPKHTAVIFIKIKFINEAIK